MIARRTYLISASSGVGAETARQLAGTQSRFFLVGRGELQGDQLVSELGALGSEAVFLEGDLTDPAVAPSAVIRCRERFGRIDALFNVAGMSGRSFGDGPVHECTEEGWERADSRSKCNKFRE